MDFESLRAQFKERNNNDSPKTKYDLLKAYGKQIIHRSFVKSDKMVVKDCTKFLHTMYIVAILYDSNSMCDLHLSEIVYFSKDNRFDTHFEYMGSIYDMDLTKFTFMDIVWPESDLVDPMFKCRDHNFTVKDKYKVNKNKRKNERKKLKKQRRKAVDGFDRHVANTFLQKRWNECLYFS